MATSYEAWLVASSCSLLVLLGTTAGVARAEAPGAAGTTVTTTATAEDDADQSDEEAGLTALVTAEHDLFKLLAGKGNNLEALGVLDRLHKRKIPAGNDEASAVVLDSYLSGIELLQNMKEYERAHALVRAGLARVGKNDLYRGYLLMSQAELEKGQGRTDRAIETLKQSVSVLESLVRRPSSRKKP